MDAFDTLLALNALSKSKSNKPLYQHCIQIERLTSGENKIYYGFMYFYSTVATEFTSINQLKQHMTTAGITFLPMFGGGKFVNATQNRWGSIYGYTLSQENLSFNYSWYNYTNSHVEVNVDYDTVPTNNFTMFVDTVTPIV